MELSLAPASMRVDRCSEYLGGTKTCTGVKECPGAWFTLNPPIAGKPSLLADTKPRNEPSPHNICTVACVGDALTLLGSKGSPQLHVLFLWDRRCQPRTGWLGCGWRIENGRHCSMEVASNGSQTCQPC